MEENVEMNRVGRETLGGSMERLENVRKENGRKLKNKNSDWIPRYIFDVANQVEKTIQTVLPFSFSHNVK